MCSKNVPFGLMYSSVPQCNCSSGAYRSRWIIRSIPGCRRWLRQLSRYVRSAVVLGVL